MGQRNISQKTTDRLGTEPPVLEHHWSYVENQSPAEDDIDDLFESPSQRPDSHSRGRSAEGDEKSSRSQAGRKGTGTKGASRTRANRKAAESSLPVPKGYLGGPEAAFDDDGDVDLLASPPLPASPRKRGRSREIEKSERPERSEQSKNSEHSEQSEKESTKSGARRRGKGRERPENSGDISPISGGQNDESANSRRPRTASASASRRQASSNSQASSSSRASSNPRTTASQRVERATPADVSPSIPELSALVANARSLGLTASELRECSIAEISARLDRAGLRLPGELGPLGVAAMVFVAQLIEQMEQNVPTGERSPKTSAKESESLESPKIAEVLERQNDSKDRKNTVEQSAASISRSRPNRGKAPERVVESKELRQIEELEDSQATRVQESPSTTSSTISSTTSPSLERSEDRKDPRSQRGPRRGRGRRRQSPFPPGSEPDSPNLEDDGTVPYTWSEVDDEPLEIESLPEEPEDGERKQTSERSTRHHPPHRDTTAAQSALERETPTWRPSAAKPLSSEPASRKSRTNSPDVPTASDRLGESDLPDPSGFPDTLEGDVEGLVEDETAADDSAKLADFGEMRFSDPMMRALQSAGYTHPTPIQAGLIPQALQGEDLMGQAQTGTGKTAAFAIPILERLEVRRTERSPMAMVLCPTRELAVQTRDEFVKLSGTRRVRIVALYGGKPIKKQLDQLRDGSDIIVGTPGRILDHLNRRTLSLSSLQTVVLDEADRMLDIGFRPDIEKILRQCPQSRQTLLLSATLPPPVKRLAERYMREPAMLDFSPTDIASQTIEQFYFPVFQEEKYTLLQSLLQRESPRQAIVFCRTRRGTEKIGRLLQRVFPGECEMIHGDLAQNHRDHVMRSFRAGEVRILVATDVVGRGIDVSGISHIINYDIPQFCDDYVHRVGRAGRMGREGVAFTLVTPEEGIELTRIEMRINKLLAKRDPAEYMERQPHQERPELGPRPVVGSSDAVPDPEAAVKPPKPVFGRPTRRVKRSL